MRTSQLECWEEELLYIADNEPLSRSQLRDHFRKTDYSSKNAVEAFRAWGYIVPGGYLRLTESGRKYVELLRRRLVREEV